MDNHNCPDKKRFIVYSDELWDEISEKTDENNKIDWLAIPRETYEMYRCPACGRLMIFGEDRDKSRFVSYEREKCD
ncbi:MAG: hypothetical protein ACI4F4_03670 [Lachnospiraceae bacterium]